jgi:hypothetical protein
LPHARFAYIAPFLKQAKLLAWDYLKRFCDPIPGRVYRESELKVVLPNGAQIGLYGADNPDAMRGIYLDGAVLDEYAQITPKIFTSILRPALSDRLGWCVFSGTPNGRNHFYDILQEAKRKKDWFWCVLKASETGIVPESELKDARDTMTEEEYEREYECSFDSIIGKKIYPEFSMKTHLADCELIPKEPVKVYRGWDNTGLHPGITLSYLTDTGQWRIFKEFWFDDTGAMEAAETVITWCNLELPFGCTYEDFGDPAGRNRGAEKMSARDYIAIKAQEMGCSVFIQDGIQSWMPRRESVGAKLRGLRNGEPALIVDPFNCPLTVEGFSGGYAYKELPGLPGHYSTEPIGNKYKDIHDSIQYKATRMFTTGDNVGTLESGHRRPYDIDEDNPFEEEFDGRSTITGY